LRLERDYEREREREREMLMRKMIFEELLLF
jgi:hypothetical protein